MDCLIHPTYIPNVAHFVAMVNSDSVCFEVCDNYQKQSFRNRTEIYGANGKMALTVPVKYTQKNRQLYKDVKIANDDNWQLHHLKSLQSAYSMSPFFEYYIDDLMVLFEKRFDYILDFNHHCFDILLDSLQLEISINETQSFEIEPVNKKDFRALVNRNYKVNTFEKYTQVFTEKHGFISNLSILDLLFNEGPNTELYLKKQNI
ncbi:WbqC family protein [Winogradskyella pulchriflava]|uniref:WbqC family protein n=1 Tax=Winogradskyella pulchriflava TaxID=1110688 RepID=A0ABV6QB09_9FLAO